MNPNIPGGPPPRTLLGPGGIPIPTQSNWICPTCKVRPPVSDQQGLPPGTPLCMVVAEPGASEASLHCLMCWNTFYAKFVRRHSPQLRQIDDLTEPAQDDDEEAE